MKWKAICPIFILNCPFDKNYNGYFVFIIRLKNCEDFNVKVLDEFSKITHRDL
jgi:hypothetical protein